MLTIKAGLLGVGVNTASAKLHVEDSISNEILLVRNNATTAVDVVQIFGPNVTGKYINTDAGSGTPAFLSNAGVWTDASCFEEYKNVESKLGPAECAGILSEVEQMTIARYTSKADRSAEPRRTLGPFQDDLVNKFGLCSEGVVGTEVAAIALAAIKALKAECDDRIAEKDTQIAELSARLDAIEAGS
jgi:hypothetical protein